MGDERSESQILVGILCVCLTIYLPSGSSHLLSLLLLLLAATALWDKLGVSPMELAKDSRELAS
jgi:hypothetical protein